MRDKMILYGSLSILAIFIIVVFNEFDYGLGGCRGKIKCDLIPLLMYFSLLFDVFLSVVLIVKFFRPFKNNLFKNIFVLILIVYPILLAFAPTILEIIDDNLKNTAFGCALITSKDARKLCYYDLAVSTGDVKYCDYIKDTPLFTRYAMIRRCIAEVQSKK